MPRTVIERVSAVTWSPSRSAGVIPKCTASLSRSSMFQAEAPDCLRETWPWLRPKASAKTSWLSPWAPIRRPTVARSWADKLLMTSPYIILCTGCIPIWVMSRWSRGPCSTMFDTVDPSDNRRGGEEPASWPEKPRRKRSLRGFSHSPSTSPHAGTPQPFGFGRQNQKYEGHQVAALSLPPGWPRSGLSGHAPQGAGGIRTRVRSWRPS